MGFGELAGEFALAAFDHRGDVAGADALGLNDFKADGESDATCGGDGFDFIAFGQQDAVGDAAQLADDGGLDGAWLGAFGQDDALLGVLGFFDQFVAEGGGRQTL